MIFTDFWHFVIYQDNSTECTIVLVNNKHSARMQPDALGRAPVLLLRTVRCDESLLDIFLGKLYIKVTKGKFAFHKQKEKIMKNRLEELRKERGIKQEELASVLKVSETDHWFIREWAL